MKLYTNRVVTNLRGQLILSALL